MVTHLNEGVTLKLLTNYTESFGLVYSALTEYFFFNRTRLKGGHGFNYNRKVFTQKDIQPRQFCEYGHRINSVWKDFIRLQRLRTDVWSVFWSSSSVYFLSTKSKGCRE